MNPSGKYGLNLNWLAVLIDWRFLFTWRVISHKARNLYMKQITNQHINQINQNEGLLWLNWWKFSIHRKKSPQHNPWRRQGACKLFVPKAPASWRFRGFTMTMMIEMTIMWCLCCPCLQGCGHIGQGFLQTAQDQLLGDCAKDMKNS